MFLVCLLVFVAGLYLFLRHRRGNKGLALPGPNGLPLVGHGLEINEHNMVDRLVDLAKVYGEMCTIQMFQQRVLCLNSVDVIKELLTGADYKRLTNDRNKFFIAEYSSGAETVAFYRDGYSVVHNRMRQAYTKGLNLYGDGIRQFEQNVLSELKNLNRKIELSNGEEIEVVSMMQRSLTNIIGITVRTVNSCLTVKTTYVCYRDLLLILICIIEAFQVLQ